MLCKHSFTRSQTPGLTEQPVFDSTAPLPIFRIVTDITPRRVAGGPFEPPCGVSAEAEAPSLNGLSLMRHPSAGPEIPDPDGVIIGFGAPAEHAFGPAVDALCRVLAVTLR